MTPESGTLTIVLDHFLSILKLGKDGLGSQAFSLLSILATIEILVAALWWAITGQDALVGLLKKLLFISFFVFVISNYDSLLHTVVDGFIQTGKVAGAGGGDSLASIKNPSSIVDAGFKAAEPIFIHLSTYSSVGALANPVDVLIALFCALGVLIAYFVIAIQVFVTYLEFGIVSTVGLILIPFGVLKHTSFLAERIFGAIISFGIKLMVLGLLVSITFPVLKTFSIPSDPTWTHLFNLLLMTFSIAALSWHAPGVAAGMMSGGPSLTASTATQSALAGGAATLSAGSIPSAAVGATSQAASMLGATTKNAAKLGGTIAGGSSVARDLTKSRGLSGPISGGAAVIGGAAGPVLAGAKKASLSIKSSFQDGQASVLGFVPFKSKDNA